MTRHDRWLLVAGLVGCGLGAVPARAAAQWEPLGARRVSFAVDHDAIVVGAREGLFNAVRIEVDGGDLEMHNIKITFGDGATFSPETRLRFREGSRSRTIDLPGQARIIRRIDFRYRSTLRRGRATVQAFGRRAAAALAPDLAGWEQLGMRPVDFRVDHDVVTAAHADCDPRRHSSRCAPVPRALRRDAARDRATPVARREMCLRAPEHARRGSVPPLVPPEDSEGSGRGHRSPGGAVGLLRPQPRRPGRGCRLRVGREAREARWQLPRGVL